MTWITLCGWSCLPAAVLAGLGVTQPPSLMIATDLDAGRLIELLPGWRLHNGPVHALAAGTSGFSRERLPCRAGTRGI